MRFTDQIGREIILDAYPKRIISIVPSQTELLYDLGLDNEVVGITKFCIHPENWFRNKERIGGTKQVNYECVDQLSPDLIIANKEENTKEIVDALSEKYPVWVSDIKDLEDALAMIGQLGEITNRKETARRIVEEIRTGFDNLKVDPNINEDRQVVHYYIWNEPDMLAGQGTFISKMIEAAGFVNGIQSGRYPIYSKEMGDADLVFLSSEPFPFKNVHIAKFQERYPNSKIIKVDGELFSWYGSRLRKTPKYLKELASRFSE